MPGKRKILFLHTELASYFLSCLETLLALYETEIYVIKLPINKEAPFQLQLHPSIHFYERRDLSESELIALCTKIDPDFIFCAGWIDKTYLKIVSLFYRSIPTVLVLDNHWSGSMKQRAAALAAPYYLLNRFSHIWVPGLYQYEYARRLGFAKENILTGMYSADVDFFQSYYHQHKTTKQQQFPKRFLYVGRYVPMKGIQELWEVFTELLNEGKTDWELWCAGTGVLEPQFPQHPKIKNFGFVQPSQIGELIEQTGVCILPSHYEPWGVVVHEFASSGMPLLCSTSVGAISSFLIDGYNGFTFKPNDKKSLKNAISKIMELPTESLVTQAERSFDLSNAIHPRMWATKIWQLTLSYETR